jgi:hypothetical protein
MNTNPTACGIGRNNIIIKPTELFRWTESPTDLVGFRIDGHMWLVHRDAQNHPHFAPMERDGNMWITRNIDGERVLANRVVVAEPGDKVAFDHKGDVWIIAIDQAAKPYFEAC